MHLVEYSLDQEGYPGDRGYARPADRPLYSLLPAKQWPTLRAETRKPLRLLVG